MGSLNPKSSALVLHTFLVGKEHVPQGVHGQERAYILAQGPAQMPPLNEGFPSSSQLPLSWLSSHLQ